MPGGIYRRRMFWTLLVGGAGLLFLVRYLLLPAIRGEPIPAAGDLLDQVLDEMLTAILVAGGLTALLSYFAPEAKSEDAVEVVAAKDRGPRLAGGRADTRRWWFSGAMGRYTRAETLPEMAAACREDGRSRSVVLQLIDPRDTELCQRYSDLRRSLRTGDQAPWSVEHVQREVVATIATAYAVATEQRLLDLRVALRPNVHHQRYDLSDTEVIITTEDSRREALSFPEGSQFYDIVQDEMRLSFEQADPLPDTHAVAVDQMDVGDLTRLLEALNLDGIGLDGADMQEVLSSMRAGRHPYD